MENMPVEYYDYYAFVKPLVDGYFKVRETEKCRQLVEKLKKIYQERLNYYAGLPLDEQQLFLDQIIPDLEAYSRNVDILIMNRDQEKAEKETLIFNDYIAKFERFYRNDNIDHILGEETMDSMDRDVITEPESDSVLIIE